MRILGVDPGSVVCGYGVIEKVSGNIILIEYGFVHVKKKNELFYSRLADIYNHLKSVINRNNPAEAVFENIFYSRNALSLVKLSHARAAAILAATTSGLQVSEYSPREIKKSVTGFGNASKEQVQYMVRNLLKIEETPEFYDSTDALAAAICHSYRKENPKKAGSSWAEFIKSNPERIVKI